MFQGFDLSFLRERKVNAALSILFTLYLTVSSANIFFDGNLTWSLYAVAIVLLVFIPTVAFRDIEAMPPFEILLLLAIPFTVKGLEIGFIASRTLNYVSAAAVALLLFSELDTHTSFSTSPKFAVYLIAILTIAMSGFWALGQWLAHVHFGMPFNATEHDLMWEFASAAGSGIVSGKIFGRYFNQRDEELKK
jgi:hypothetical protein